MAKNRKTKKSVKAASIGKVTIPDEAVFYIVSHYLQGKNKEGELPIVVGISTQTVIDIMHLFVDWAVRNGYVKDGVLTLGGHKID